MHEGDSPSNLFISPHNSQPLLKVALQILGRKFTKILKNHPYTPKTFWFLFIKPQLSKAIRQQEKLEIYYGPGRHRRETRSIFTQSQLSRTCLIGTLAYQEIDEKTMSTVNVREFPEFGELQLCVIANR